MSILFSCNNDLHQSTPQKQELTRFVDPYIGTGFHGHVFMGANVPFGAVQLGPTNMSQGWDWCSGYHISDSTIMGFAHTHLSGTGIGDLGDISFMPVTGEVTMARGTIGKPETGYYSLFSHAEEKAVPGYYSVNLKRYNVKAEMTASERVGFQQYTFPASEDAKIIIDLETGIGWDSPKETYLKWENDTTVTGYRYSKGWAADQRIFFTAIFSKPVNEFVLYDGHLKLEGKSVIGKKIRGAAKFTTSTEEKIMVKVGISPVSIENAGKNIKAEIPGWDFEEVVLAADEAWNQELNKIKIESKDTGRLRTFYTAFYHTMIAPSLFDDHNGDYRGTDKKVYKNASSKNYTTFSLWDTYRAAHPLFTIIQSDRTNDFIQSMLAIYQQQGKLPVWHLHGNETNTMPGHSGIQVVADAYLKGFRGFDTTLIWEALETSAMLDERGMKYIRKYGYIPADSMVESVAMGLEYAISDWGITQVAKKMGKKDDFDYFRKRSENYHYYFDPVTRFVRGRLSETDWRTPFDPFHSRHREDDFSEGNAWQYTWLMPHDVEGLIKLMGGEKPFVNKLDSLFSIEGAMGDQASNDITGLIGQYAHGNEPSHHITYLYAYAGEPWKTAGKVRYILDSLYHDTPAGISGNEDVGQMSAWYILSTLGFYQVNPSSGVYVFGSPAIDAATLHLDNGNIISISVRNNSSRNIYIQSVKFNGKDYSKTYILYKDLMSGGKWEIIMGDNPSKTWGTERNNWPQSAFQE